jgi:hypothetical protein
MADGYSRARERLLDAIAAPGVRDGVPGGDVHAVAADPGCAPAPLFAGGRRRVRLGVWRRAAAVGVRRR